MLARTSSAESPIDFSALAAPTLGFSSPPIRPRSAVTLSLAFRPMRVMLAIDAATSSKLTPAAAAIGSTAPSAPANSCGSALPSLTACTRMSVAHVALSAPSP